jgi:hypothetical protein
MSVGKRKVYGSTFKAKVGLEAIRGVKTVNEIEREGGLICLLCRLPGGSVTRYGPRRSSGNLDQPLKIWPSGASKQLTAQK